MRCYLILQSKWIFTQRDMINITPDGILGPENVVSGKTSGMITITKQETDRNPFLLGEQQLTASWNSDIPQPLMFREMSLPSRHQPQMPRRCERKRNHHLCHPQHLRWSLSQPWRLKKSIGGCGWECLVWYSWEYWYHAVREKRWTIENGRLRNSKAVESECLYFAAF